MKLGVTIWLLSIALLIEAQKIAQNQTPKNSRTEEINGGDERRRHLTISEVNGKTLSISFRIDEGVIEHNNRIFIAKNVDGERVQDKITYCRQDIREYYIDNLTRAQRENNKDLDAPSHKSKLTLDIL